MKKYLLLILLFVIGLGISALQPHDYFTWVLEVFPAVLGLAILMLTFKQFRFTYFVYLLILAHCYILFIGGHYTYAEVPLFNSIQEMFGHERNNYDKIGHFAQGFVPAAITRELFYRLQVLRPGYWLNFLSIAVCVFISVCYEFLEWFVAIVSGQSAEAFLGTQGYEWDTQSDMLMAFLGATAFILIFSPYHNKQMEKMITRPAPVST